MLVLMAAGHLTPTQFLVVQVLGFIVLAGVLVKLVFPALGKILGGRTREIEDTFNKIDQDTKDTAARIADIKARLAQVTEESQRRLKATLDDADKTRTQLLADANAQVQAALAKSKAEIQIERDKAVLELKYEATRLTLQAAEHLVQTTMNDPIHEKIVDRYLSQLDSVKKT